MFCFPNHVANVVVLLKRTASLKISPYYSSAYVSMSCVKTDKGEFAAQEHHPHIKEGLDGGYKCQLSVRVLAICQLSVKFKAICQLSVNWLLIINEVI